MNRPWSAVSDSLQRSHVLGKTSLIVVLLAAYSILVIVVDRWFFDESPQFGAQLHGLLGLVLGFLLVFRTNTSYDRWWEARKLWGQLVNDSRNLAIKVACCVRTEPADKYVFGRHLADFAWALKGHLQGGRPLNELAGYRQATETPAHVPLYVVRNIYQQIESWRCADRLDGFEFWVVDRHAVALMDICGACERIQKTPIAHSHRAFIRFSIACYLLTLPWGLLEQFKLWIVPATMLLGFLLVGVELIAETIENPFGHTIDDLSLGDLCRTVESGVLEVLPAPSPEDS